MGIPNARVLPDPVLALPIRSWPARISGMAEDWIGVGVVKESFDRARRVGRERPNESQAGSGTRFRVGWLAFARVEA